jgi:type IV secretion system protein VirB10
MTSFDDDDDIGASGAPAGSGPENRYVPSPDAAPEDTVGGYEIDFESLQQEDLLETGETDPFEIDAAGIPPVAPEPSFQMTGFNDDDDIDALSVPAGSGPEDRYGPSPDAASEDTVGGYEIDFESLQQEDLLEIGEADLFDIDALSAPVESGPEDRYGPSPGAAPDDNIDGYEIDFGPPQQEGLLETGETDPFEIDAAGVPPVAPNLSFQIPEPSSSGEPADPIGEGKITPEALATDESNDDPLAPYAPPGKKSPSEVIQAKPPSLNKRILLFIIVFSFAGLIIFITFIAPLINFDLKKPVRQAKPAAVNVDTPDYYSIASRSRNSGEDAPPPEDTLPPDLPQYDNISESFPPVADETRQDRPDERVENPSPGGGGIYTRPDTRNDRLQAKSISGIKGITPTQRQYLQADTAVPPALYQNPYQPPRPESPPSPYAQFGMPSREEYTNQVMSQYGAQYGQANMSPYARQNDQSGKTAFYNSGRENAGGGYWLSPNSIWQGTIFEATLTSNINTDLPGECTAMITKNVYSSQDGQYLLIPQNSRLLGSYNSSISYSQSRVQVGWHTLIRPDGYFINLGNMQATDPRGAAGLPGFINDHPFQYLKAIALLSAFNIIGNELAYSTAGAENRYVQNVLANTQDVSNTLAAKIIDRALDVQPTITINAGTSINIVANTNLVLPPLEPYPVVYPYHRGE